MPRPWYIDRSVREKRLSSSATTEAVFSQGAYTYVQQTEKAKKRAQVVSSTSLADQQGSKQRFREARKNGRTLAQQVAFDIVSGTENYSLCL